ncbi:conserved hypothetical protein, partial [Ricinus communis]
RGQAGRSRRRHAGALPAAAAPPAGLCRAATGRRHAADFGSHPPRSAEPADGTDHDRRRGAPGGGRRARRRRRAGCGMSTPRYVKPKAVRGHKLMFRDATVDDA